MSGSSVAKNALLMWDQRRMPWLVQAGKKATVSQITTCYNSGMQKSVSEHTTRQTLKRSGHTNNYLIKWSLSVH